MIAASAIALWVGLLALLAAVVSRELNLLQTERAGASRQVLHGPPIGSFVRSIGRRAQTFLFLDANCAPCDDLLLRIGRVPTDTVLVIKGDVERAAASIARHEPATSLVGRDAAALFERLGIVATPFALRTMDGIVVGKSLPSTPADLGFPGPAELPTH